MTSKRGKRTTAEVAAQDETEDHEPLADPETVPDDLAAAAQALHQAAKDAGEQAVRCRAEAESVMSAAQADADRVIREGHARALPLIAGATDLERQAVALGGRSKHMEHAARQEALAEEQEALADGLTADRERLAETIADLDSRLSQLGTDRERLTAEVAEARAAGGVPRLAVLRSELEATADAMDGLREQQVPAQARVAQIGDGTETGPGELLDALTAARTHRKALTAALDELFPDRPGAEHRRDLDRLKGALAGNLARIAEEARIEPSGRRRHGFAGVR